MRHRVKDRLAAGWTGGLFVCLFVIIHGSKAYKTYAGQKKTESCPRGLSHLSRPPYNGQVVGEAFAEVELRDE
jgi:hypothetical protein